MNRTELCIAKYNKCVAEINTFLNKQNYYKSVSIDKALQQYINMNQSSLKPKVLLAKYNYLNAKLTYIVDKYNTHELLR